MRWLTLKHVLAFCLLGATANIVGVVMVRREADPEFYKSPTYREYLRWRRIYSNPFVTVIDLLLVGTAFWWVARRQKVKPNEPVALFVFGVALGNLLGMLCLFLVPL